MHRSNRNLIGGLLAVAALAALVGAGPANAQTPAVIAATSPGATIGPANPTVTVPVTISRDNTSPVLGFSVRIQLSSEFSALAISGSGTDVALGNFLTDHGRATNLQVVSNGSGVYTIDGVTLGTDCGPPEQTGTLFTVRLRSSAAAGPGTVTIQSVTLRDCSNLPIAANAGSGATVAIDNTAPSVTVTAPNGGESWVYQTSHAITWTATDASGITSVDLEYSTNNGSSWTTVSTGEANDGTYTWAIPNTPTSNALVRVTAHDTNGNNASDVSDAVFMLLSNTAPVLDPIGNRTVNEATALTFTATASDGEAPPQTLTFSLDAGAPAGASITSGGLFSWTPTEAQGPGDYPVTVRVTDDGSPPLDDFETITVHVNEVNVAPVLGAIGDKSVNEETALTFTATATDADVPANTLTFSLDAGAPAGASITAGGLFSWTPTEAQGPGDYPVTVRVTDDGVPPLDDFETITVHVAEVNVAPVLAAIGDKSVNEETALTFTASATDADVPANALTFSLDAGAPAGAGITAGGLFAWTPTEAQGPGDYPITVRVTDDGVPPLSASETITVHVAEVNVAPVLTGVPAEATIPELVLYTFDADATDHDLPAQTLTFSLVGAPTGAAIHPGTGVFTWTPAEDQGPGDYTFAVRVSDGTANTDAPITLHVTDTNSPPSLTGVPTGTVNIPEMALYTFDADASDSDIPAQTLTFSLQGTVPAGAGIDPGTGVFTWTPSEVQGPGNYPITVRVTDGVANTEASFTLHVDEVNIAPALTGVPASATIPELVLYTFDADATDPDLPANTLTFSLVGAPAGAAIDPGTGVFTWTPSEAQGPGTYPFAVRVSDGAANTDAPITLTVTDVSIAAIADLSASTVRSGNDGDGTTKVLLNWTATPEGTTVEVYRARFGSYPEYDDAAGSTPATPATPPAPGGAWELTAVTAPGQTDEVNNGPADYAGRDFWHYVAFVHGAGLNVSGPSNKPATPNYLLGDVTDGTAPSLGRGDNRVNGDDISALGFSYGLTGPAMTAVNYLDVGPTTDHSVNGRPLTDNAIDFEDLVIFAIDFGAGPAPQLAARAARNEKLLGADQLMTDVPSWVTAGQEFTVRLRLQGSGRVHALSTTLDWDHAVAEPLGVTAGAWLEALNGVALSSRPGMADVALLGPGTGFAGEGVVAELRFRALVAGDPHVTVAALTARDGANQDVQLATSTTAVQPPIPVVTLLSPAFPNPFSASTTINFSLAQAGPVSVTIYGVDGRMVRSLASGRREAGVYHLEWNGRDDQGNALSSGIYFVQMATQQSRSTKKISYVR